MLGNGWSATEDGGAPGGHVENLSFLGEALGMLRHITLLPSIEWSAQTAVTVAATYLSRLLTTFWLRVADDNIVVRG